MQLAIVQNNPKIGAVPENLSAVAQLLTGINADLIVLPELFCTGYFFHSLDQIASLAEELPHGPATQFMLQYAAEHDCFVCGGVAEKSGSKIYNSALLAGPAGMLGVYRKLHLFNEEQRWFTPGNQPPRVYQTGGARVGMMICFDWRFPEVARSLALQGAQVLLHPANLVQQHCQAAMITRCLENGVFAATANRVGTDVKPDGATLTFTGRSQVVDPSGNTLCQLAVDEPAVYIVEIDPGAADNKMVTPNNHLLNDRRPEYYGSNFSDEQ